jgi:hypothetical protein
MSQPMPHSTLIVILLVYSALKVTFVLFTVAPTVFCLFVYVISTSCYVMSNRIIHVLSECTPQFNFFFQIKGNFLHLFCVCKKTCK